MLAQFIKDTLQYKKGEKVKVTAEQLTILKDGGFAVYCPETEEEWIKAAKDGAIKGILERNPNAKEIAKYHGDVNNILFEENFEPNNTLTEIYSKLKSVFSKYIDTTDENKQIVCNWIIGTYSHNQFETYPLLQFNAQKQSGKTRTLKLCSALSCGSDGTVSTSITETQLFRRKGKAVFFDEMESINGKERSALRETLNAVYKRGNKIIRYNKKKTKDGEEYVEEAFEPYYPVALANINGYGDVLADRALSIVLQRSNSSLTKLIEDYSTNPDIITLKNSLDKLKLNIPKNLFSEWNLFVQTGRTNDKQLQPFFEKINSTKILGRPLELFFPLFVIAYLCKNLDNFLEIAKSYVEIAEEESLVEDIDERLKKFMVAQAQSYVEFTPVSRILTDFRNCIEHPEDWINNKWFGRALKRLGFVKHKRIINGRIQVQIVIPKETLLNTTNTTNSTNSTNSTKFDKQVGFSELVELGRENNIVDKKSCGIEFIENGETFICGQLWKDKPKRCPMCEYGFSEVQE